VERYRQRGLSSREAGGQLFGRVADDGWAVEQATGPRRSDFRTRFNFRPNRSSERREIEELFREGLHYLGDWHTHPEIAPEPSSTDIESMQEMVVASRHELPGFIMMIVGTGTGTAGLSISLHYRRGGWRRYSVRIGTSPEGRM
jgi:integrative and conjugative element protein (TIGR02256 family)